MTKRKQGGVQVQLRCLHCGRGPIKGTKYPYGDAYERVYSGGLKKHLLSQKGTCYQHYEKNNLVGWSASSENAVDFRSSVVGYWSDAIKVTKKATYMSPPSETPMISTGTSSTTTPLYNNANTSLGTGANWMGGGTSDDRSKRHRSDRSLRESREQYETCESDRGQKRKAIDFTDNETAKRSSSSIASRSTRSDGASKISSAREQDIPRAIKVEKDGDSVVAAANSVSPEQQQQQQLEEPSMPPIPRRRRSLELSPPPPPHVERRKDETALEQTVGHLQEQLRAQKEWFEALFQNQAKEVAALATKVRNLEDAAMKQATNRRKMASALQEATLALLKE